MGKGNKHLALKNACSQKLNILSQISILILIGCSTRKIAFIIQKLRIQILSVVNIFAGSECDQIIMEEPKMMHIQNVPRQNVPRDQTSYLQKVLGTKRPKGQNVPRDKTSQGQNVPRTKRPKDKTSQGTKRPMGTNEDHYLTCVANYLIWVIWPG